MPSADGPVNCDRKISFGAGIQIVSKRANERGQISSESQYQRLYIATGMSTTFDTLIRFLRTIHNHFGFTNMNTNIRR